MYLKKLEANKNSVRAEKFKTIEFDNAEINIILGTVGHKDKKGKTVNGVGKTLSLKLIDFCLGAKLNTRDKLSKLEDWEFILDVCIEDKNRSFKRSISDANTVYIDNEDKKLKEFNTWLENELLDNLNTESMVSFRNVISRFLRLPKDGYITWEKCKKKEQDDVSLLSNSFVLGLNTDVIENKIRIKEQLNDINKTRSIIKNDSSIKESLQGIDVGINLTTLKKDIEKLEEKISKFKIAEGHEEIKKNIEIDKYKAQNLINERQLKKNMLSTINESLKVEIDVTYDKVKDLYEEANVVLSDMVQKQLQEVNNFHIQLLSNRKNRLKEDKKTLTSVIKKLDKEIEQVNNRINSNLLLLKTGGSISELEVLQNELLDKKIRLSGIEKHSTLLKDINSKILDYKSEMAQQNAKASQYLNEIEDYVDNLSSQFKEFVDYIYEETRTAGISIENNDKDNKIQFNINPEIKDDESAGVNNVKIFCMDLLYLKLQKNNHIGFIYHDNSIFAETDVRQIYRMIKLAYDICSENNLQYIVNLNYDMFNQIIEIAQEENSYFAEHLEKRVILRLKDDSVDDKLLGEDI
ncbi:DUF2326 domain-containing protein [Zhenhengia yiwuensis]|uniref:DUF2326 domain-containing protein n=1 Tax=Zhenhengia yiwuensis TaxID=2763666 RepID=A0A926IE88_9FIRM|nr:DUF2326 domain-containing protein [Zhenhengia yiwuensis]MBC8579503.1 DUF2326 domain-containing protein [Zhenhengia yiwuensis]